MVAQPETRDYVHPDDYLAMERVAEGRSEYVDGVIVAKSGSSREHNLIVVNLGGELGAQLKGQPCETYLVAMRVRIPAVRSFFYPNVVVVCGEPHFDDSHVDTLANPTLVIEVLSDSTERYDRSRKARAYRALDTLREYVFVSQDEPRVEVHSRQPDGRWLLSEAAALDESIDLASIGCTLALAEVYDRVSFA